MIREAFKRHRVGLSKEFHFRGEEPGRLENFSDAVFALAITLLLISTTPPTNFDQIKRFAWDLIPFSLCIVIIIMVWFEHFTFFYRYGLRNGAVVVLNALFLVIVLFYMYPLKFLTKLLLIPLSMLFDQPQIRNEFNGIIKNEDMASLMIIYGIGFASIFLILALMYRLALKNAKELDLNEIEVFDTGVSMKTNFIMTSVAILSVIAALILKKHWSVGMVSGMIYFIFAVVMPLFSMKMQKKRIMLLGKKDPLQDAYEKTPQLPGV